MNWGHGIALLICAFITFMMFMLYQAMQIDHELVSNDYYAKEVAFQQKINEQQNTKNLAEKPSWEITADAFVLSIPTTMHSGQINFFRPSNSKLDFVETLQLNSTQQQEIPLSKFKNGLYNLQLSWTDSDKNYYLEKQIYFPKDSIKK